LSQAAGIEERKQYLQAGQRGLARRLCGFSPKFLLSGEMRAYALLNRKRRKDKACCKTYSFYYIRSNGTYFATGS
jgi:hypothetical protein